VTVKAMMKAIIKLIMMEKMMLMLLKLAVTMKIVKVIDDGPGDGSLAYLSGGTRHIEL